MNLKEYKKKALKDPKFRREYYKHDIGLEVALSVMGWRIAARLTQTELAKRAKIKASTLSRIESGTHLPTIKTLDKIVTALGKNLTFKLK